MAYPGFNFVGRGINSGGGALIPPKVEMALSGPVLFIVLCINLFWLLGVKIKI